MQTFAEWLEAKLAERGWTAADLTEASREPEYPRGLDSGLISRWRRQDALAVVPTQAKTISRLARALTVSESEVYRAAGLAPSDAVEDPHAIINAKRQSIRDQLDRWLTAVGPENEEFFWEHLKAQGDSTVELFKRIQTAVNADTEGAVNAAVSERSKRGRKPRGSSGGPLRHPQHAPNELLEVGHSAPRQRTAA